jgi:DHA1 family inner membrane transport protein
VAVGVEGLVVSPVLHDVATAFGTSPAQAGWAVSAYGLTLAVVAPIIGLWGDHISRKTTMTTGLCLFVIAGLLCALSTTFWMLAAARAACGAAAGAFLPSCYAYVGDSTAYAERGRVMGRVMAGWSVSLILGIPIGGAIAQIWGWRATFVAVSALGCVAAFLVARMPSVAPQRVPGLSVTTAASLVFSNGVPRLMLVNFLDMLSFYGVYTFLGVVVLERLSVGSGVFGLFVLCYGVGLMLSTMNARVLDRFGKEKVLMPALALLGILLLILIPATYQPVALAGCMLIWGVLQGIVQTGTATIITQASDKARGFGMACMSCTTYMAVGLGALGGGWLHSTHGFGALALAGALAALLASLVLHGYKAIQPPSPPVCTSQT